MGLFFTSDIKRLCFGAEDVKAAYIGSEQVWPVGPSWIEFADPEVLRVLLANGVDTDGDGGITEEEAAAVAYFNRWFVDNKEIETFNEFAKFTSIKYLQWRGDLTIESFKGCSALREITIPEHITVIGNGSDSYTAGAFRDCTSLVTVGGIERLTEIGNMAFKNCTSLVVGNILQNVVKLGISAFHKCTNAFSELDLPNVTTFNQEALKGVSLTRLSIPKLTALPSASASIENYGLKAVLEEIVLSDELTTIPSASFYGYTNLSKINIPESVTTIGNNAFYSCSKLEKEEMNLPNLTSLGKNVFYGVNLKTILIGLGLDDTQSVTLSVGTSTMETYGKKATLEEIVFSKNVTNILDSQLYNYTALRSIVFLSPTPPSASNTSNFYGSTCPIYVPDDSVEAYKNATNWTGYTSRITNVSLLETDNPTLYNKIKNYL